MGYLDRLSQTFQISYNYFMDYIDPNFGVYVAISDIGGVKVNNCCLENLASFFAQKKSKTGRPHHHKSKGGETVKVHIGKGYAQIKKSDKPEGMSFTQFLISLGASPKAAKVALKNHD